MNFHEVKQMKAYLCCTWTEMELHPLTGPSVPSLWLRLHQTEAQHCPKRLPESLISPRGELTKLIEIYSKCLFKLLASSQLTCTDQARLQQHDVNIYLPSLHVLIHQGKRG